MFHRGLLLDDARLTEAADAAYGELENSVRAYLGITVDAPLDGIGEAMRFSTWSIVHGFAHLVLEGRLNSVSGGSTGAVEQMLPVILAELLPRRTGAGPV